MSSQSEMSIKDFYEGKTVFLSGGTGFLGRLLLAKILRSTNVREIIMLCRPKKGKTNDERLDNIFNGFLFANLKDRSKIKIVNGDMEIDGLDLSFDDRDYITDNAQIILHGAATVRFDEQLQKAIKINVRGTKNMLELAAKAQNLMSFVHISTAYSQCPRLFIKETFYAPPMDYKLALKLLDEIANEDLKCLTTKLIHPWPNTYSFTKAVTEDMIRQNVNGLPISIIRPSVVIATFKDPAPGFFDSILGPLGGLIGIHCGLMRVLRIHHNAHMDVVPADIVINSILAVSAAVSKKDYLPKIFNCVSTNSIWISFSHGISRLLPTMFNVPLNRAIWMPTITFCDSEFTFKIRYFAYHYVPAFFIDFIMRLKGSKIRLVNIYSKIFGHFQNLAYFMNRSWKFENENMVELNNKMSLQDREDFTVSMSEFSMSVDEYLRNIVHGVRKYFFNETEEDLMKARKKLFIFKILHYILLFMIYTAMFYFGFRMFNRFNQSISNTVGNAVKHMNYRSSN